MKRIIICTVLIAAMLVTGTALYIHTENFTADISGRVTELRRMSGVADSKTTAAAARAVSRDWERFCAENIFLTNNECAFEVSEALVRIVAEAESGDDIDEECITAVMLIELYNESRKLSPGNVF